MFRALVELGERLEAERESFPATGLYIYKEPLKWTIHLEPGDPPRVDITASDSFNPPRPYSGRTSGILPHPVADEAAYVLGTTVGHDDKVDKRASVKHPAYLTLLEEAIDSVQ